VLRVLCCVPGTEALPGEAGVLITLDMAAIAALQLQVDAADVKWAILGTPKLKLKTEHVRAILPNQVGGGGRV
jgi:DNA-directed RNA polymerase III subunit RPC1